MTYRITNPKGEIRTGLTKEDMSNFKKSLGKKGITDPKAAGYVVEIEHDAENDLPSIAQHETNKNPTYAERREYFKNTSPTLAEVFPNLAEQYMKGNTGYNLGTLNAGISDVLSYPGRLLMSIGNSKDSNDNEGFNLGRRSQDVGGTGFGNTVRSPMFTGGLLLTPAMGATSAAGGMLPNIGRGAAIGAAFGGTDAELSGREAGPMDYGVGAAVGGAFEPVATVASKAVQLLRKFGGNLERAVASALKLGNTERMLTDAEYAAFRADPANKEVFDEAMNAVESYGNINPLKTDKGKGLTPLKDDARAEAAAVLKDEPALKQGASEGVDPTLSVTERDIQRRANVANDPNTEPYQMKTVYKPGKHDITEQAYQREFSEPRLFEAKPKNTKDPYYQSNVEYNMEKFADKYDNIGSQIENIKIDPYKKELTFDEKSFLDDLEREVAQDHSVLEGYNPQSGTYDLNKVLQANKFLGDRVPFNQSFYNERVAPFIEEHNARGVSEDFYNEVNRIIAQAHNFGRSTMNNFRDAFTGKEHSVLERAFAYAKNGERAVKKGTRDAFDRFADTLSDYADESVGQLRVNSKGEQYLVDKEKSGKYAFVYLKKLQDSLEKNMAVSPDTIIGLYGDATLHNDKVVQDAVLQLLRDLNVDESVIRKFESVGRKYVMLKKARIKLDKNAKDDANPFKGTIAAPIYPQEGVNTQNILGYKASNALDYLGGGRNPEIPWNLGDIMRLGAYSQGGNNR